MTLMQSLISYGDSPLSLTYRTTANSGTVITGTWTPPAAAEIGDLEILFHLGWDNDGEFLDNNDIPSGVGFTSLYTNSGSVSGTSNYLSVIVTRRILTDKVSQTFVDPGLDGRLFIAYYFTPSKPITSYTMSAVGFQSIVGDPVDQTVTASSETPPLIVFGIVSQVLTGVQFNVQSPAFDVVELATAATQMSSRVGMKLYNSSPQDHTIGKADQGAANMLASFYLRVS